MSDRTRRTAHLALAAILLVALLLRVGWALRQPADDHSLAALPDQLEYLSLGRSLLAGEGLRFYDSDFRQWIYAFRTPGYPAFLAICGGSVRAARLAQAVIDTSTVLAVYLLARRWLGQWQSLLAATLAALNPFLIYLSSLLLTESLFTAMLAWGMVLLVHRGSFLWGGVVLAIAILVRPSGLLLPILLGSVSVFVNRHRREPYQQQRWPLPVATTMLLLTALVLLPWAYRNYRVLGEWVLLTTNSGITNYDGLNPNATGASDQAAIRAMPILRSMGEIERDEYLADLAREFVKEHPRRTLELAAIKAGRMWSPVPLSQQYGSQRLYVAAGLIYSLPLMLLALLGLVSGRGGLPRAAKAFLLLPALYLTLVHSLSVGSLRYRIPIEPQLAVLAAAGAAAIVVRMRRPADDVGQASDWQEPGGASS